MLSKVFYRYNKKDPHRIALAAEDIFFLPGEKWHDDAIYLTFAEKRRKILSGESENDYLSKEQYVEVCDDYLVNYSCVDLQDAGVSYRAFSIVYKKLYSLELDDEGYFYDSEVLNRINKSAKNMPEVASEEGLAIFRDRKLRLRELRKKDKRKMRREVSFMLDVRERMNNQLDEDEVAKFQLVICSILGAPGVATDDTLEALRISRGADPDAVLKLVVNNVPFTMAVQSVINDVDAELVFSI